MAVETPAAFNQAGSYAAEQSRRAWFGEIALPGGIKGGFDFQLAAPVSGMSVNVGGASGALDEAYIAGTSTGTQGVYYGHLSSQTNVSIGASNTQPRVDSVYAQVTDAEYAGASNVFELTVVPGTPTGGATLMNLDGIGAAPASSLLIGYVLVPASTMSIVSGDILQATPQAYLGNIGPFNIRPISATSTTAANSGDHIAVSAGNATVDLPQPFVNARIMVTNYGSGYAEVHDHSSEKIYGYGMGSSGSSTCTLQAYGATATFWSDGVSWFITAGQQDSGWITPSLLNSWANYNSGYATMAYRLQGNWLSARGAIVGGASDTEVTVLGYTPTANRLFSSGALVAGGASNIVVTSGGVLTAYYTGSPTFITLDNVLYPVD